MNRKRIAGLLLALALATLVMAGCGSAPKANPIRPGTWSAATDFGTITFVVNPDSQSIPRLTYDFATPVRCSSVTLSGKLMSTSDPAWTISGGQLTIDRTISVATSGTTSKHVNLKLVGTFDSSGERASGTWEATQDGQPCSAGTKNWVASVSTAQAVSPTSTPAR